MMHEPCVPIHSTDGSGYCVNLPCECGRLYRGFSRLSPEDAEDDAREKHQEHYHAMARLNSKKPKWGVAHG